jgi:TIR domain
LATWLRLPANTCRSEILSSPNLLVPVPSSPRLPKESKAARYPRYCKLEVLRHGGRAAHTTHDTRMRGCAHGGPPGQVDFFISYTAADRAWAEWIAWQLESERYTTVLQAWDFVPGENFVVRMRDALEQADRTIA